MNTKARAIDKSEEVETLKREVDTLKNSLEEVKALGFRLISERDASDKIARQRKEEAELYQRKLELKERNEQGDWRPAQEDPAELYGDHFLDIDRRNGAYYWRTKDGIETPKAIGGHYTSRNAAKKRYDHWKKQGV